MSLVTSVAADPQEFMRVASQGASLGSHADLWRWLRDDVQPLLPHELLVAAWGDFQGGGELSADLVSSLPGLRTHECRAARLAPLLNYLRDCWVAARYQPCEVDVSGSADLFGTPGHGWAPGHAISCMRHAVVHGIREARTGHERMFAALGRTRSPAAGGPVVLKMLVPFIDSALRSLPAARNQPVRAEQAELEALVGPMTALSERERQIMVWVAMGKTNPEIGCILRISEFTVKNHMKSIFMKLDVTNRAQAVAKISRMAAYA
jgi:transcriptional regulator EpsA